MKLTGDKVRNMRRKEDGRGKRELKYTDEDLLGQLKDFYQKNGRVPRRRDFTNGSGHPNFSTYRRRFGCWGNAIAKMLNKGWVVQNTIQNNDYVIYTNY